IDLELAFDCLYELHGCILHHIGGKSNRAFFPRLKSGGLPRGKDGEILINTVKDLVEKIESEKGGY
ncbi:MAG: hypothetical protein ACPLKX_08190, partial [Dictyoglomaceae bacterium]